MNERFKLLAGRAGFEMTPSPWSSDELVPCVHLEGPIAIELEKFAELIVWEAIELCKVNVDALTSPFLSEYEKGIVEGYRRANENLRYYFGVEE